MNHFITANKKNPNIILNALNVSFIMGSSHRFIKQRYIMDSTVVLFLFIPDFH